MSTKTPAEKKLILLFAVFGGLMVANFSTNGLKRFGEGAIGNGWGNILQGGFRILGVIIFSILARRIAKQIKLEKENQRTKS